ncbi:hypothetical protein V8B97DRAFT_1874054 [Scleroderma yunnanense]
MASPPPPPATSTHSQLAALLASSYREKESLQKDLSSTRKRLDAVERQLAILTKPSSSSSPNAGTVISEAAQRLIADLEARVERAEVARDEADARRRLITEAWEELHRYLGILDLRAQDARADFSRIVAEGGGPLVLAPIPVLGHHGSLHTPPSATSPAIMLVPPSHSRAHHRQSSSSSSLPPPQSNTPSSSRVRPRSGSFDDQSPYLSAPPSKRHRSDRVDYDNHHPSSLRTPHLSFQPSYPTRSSHATHSRSSSRSSQRSLSIDEMLLEASTDDPRPRNEPQSPRVVLAHHQHPSSSSHHHPHPGTASSRPLAAASTVGPLDQPGELRTYQTHVFAPPVTGAPTKKGKLGLANGVPTLPTPSATSTSSTAPPQTPTSHSLPSHTHPHHAQHHPSHVHPQPLAQASPPAPSTQQPPQPTVQRTANGSYPPTNQHGQRICRQCGLAGRYKDGKCVEKWGPGPEGPGTVCDRCRKKMKRVERRGTVGGATTTTTTNAIGVGASAGAGNVAVVEGGNPLTHAHTMPARVSRSDTVPAHALANTGGTGNGANGNAVGPGGTQIIGAGFGSKRERDRDRERARESGDRDRERYPSSQPPSQSPHPHPHPPSHLHPHSSNAHLHPHTFPHPQYLHGRTSPSQRSSHGLAGHTPLSSVVAGGVISGAGADTGQRPGSREGQHGGPLPSPPPAIATLPPDEDDQSPSASAAAGTGTKPSVTTSGPGTASGTTGRSSKIGRVHRGSGKVRSGVRPSGSSSGSADGDANADAAAEDGEGEGEGEGDLDADGEEDADGDGEGVDAEGEDADVDVDAEAEAQVEGERETDMDVDSGLLNRPDRSRDRRAKNKKQEDEEDEGEQGEDRDGEEGDKDPEDDLLEAVAAADRRKGGVDLDNTTTITPIKGGSIGLSAREMFPRFDRRGAVGVQRTVVPGASVGVQRAAVKGE